MLLRQNFRWSHQRDLIAFLNGDNRAWNATIVLPIPHRLQ